MKTKKDISIALILLTLGLVLLLPILLSKTFIQNPVGQLWTGFSALIILLGILKIEHVELANGRLIKKNPLFQKVIELKSIEKFKVKQHNMNNYPQYNIAATLRLFKKNGKRYSNFRFLTVYDANKRRLTIDERTMSTVDFNSIISEVKRGKNTPNKL